MKKLFLVIFFIFSFLAAAENITIVTEDYPPYNYVENGKVTGLSTEVVQEVLKELKIDAKIEVYPWARAYEMAQSQPNVIIYSIGRNEKRENLFKWIGVIAPYKVSFFALAERNDIKINSLEDAKKYKIGTTKNDAREQYLVSKGFVVGQHIEEVDANNLNMKKLIAKRIDLLPLPDLVAYELAKKEGLKENDIKKVFELKDISSEGLYMAFSKDTSDELVNKFKAALEKIKKNGTYDKIQKKYVK